MNGKQNRFAVWMLAVSLILTLLTMGYIFYNSSQPRAVSAARSDAIEEKVNQVIESHEQQSPAAPSQGNPQTPAQKPWLVRNVRKFAHVIEFMALGVCLGGFCGGLYLLRRRVFVFLPLFWSLGTAVGDECLQLFTERGSEVVDVVLDFAGALIGLLLFSSVFILCFRIFRPRASAGQ